MKMEIDVWVKKPNTSKGIIPQCTTNAYITIGDIPIYPKRDIYMRLFLWYKRKATVNGLRTPVADIPNENNYKTLQNAMQAVKHCKMQSFLD